METKTIFVKARKSNDDLIFVTNNDYSIELLESIKIKDLKFQIEVIQEIREGFQFNVRLTNSLKMNDFFQFVVTFLGVENKKIFSFSFSTITGNNQTIKGFNDIDVKYILFDSDLNFDLNLKISQL
ncbi:MAG: hypothetical protein KBC58_09870 [Flavobacterium sp.]|nr:hypothetical protein [Flavobacterium sp.]